MVVWHRKQEMLEAFALVYPAQENNALFCLLATESHTKKIGGAFVVNGFTSNPR